MTEANDVKGKGKGKVLISLSSKFPNKFEFTTEGELLQFKRYRRETFTLADGKEATYIILTLLDETEVSLAESTVMKRQFNKFEEKINFDRELADRYNHGELFFELIYDGSLNNKNKSFSPVKLFSFNVLEY